MIWHRVRPIITISGRSMRILWLAELKPARKASVDQLKFGIVSCSNYEGGYFNAYGALARRNDLDAVVHLGDYIYEYGAGTYGIPLPDRVNVPDYEILTLADYRTRYGLYRMDEDLIRLHQQHTMIAIWDDHESANDSYVDGAENHQLNEGSWEERKAISKQVYFEWMPVREETDQHIYRSLAYGDLAELIMLDTRLEGRVAPPPHFDTPDDPPRHMISPAQEAWLVDRLMNSEAHWKVVGNQVLFTDYHVGFAAGFTDGIPDPTNLDSIRAAEDLFIDNWESYPTQRNALLDTFRNQQIDNVVIVTGDSHTSWAFDVTKRPVDYPNPLAGYLPQPNPYDPQTKEGYNPDTGEGSWAVEFGTPSISSPNFDEAVGATATATFEVFMNQPITLFGGVTYNPHLKYVDLDRHGYLVLDLSEAQAQADFYYVPGVSLDTVAADFGQGAFTADQTNRVQLTDAPAPDKAEEDDPTPMFPFGATTSLVSPPSAAVLFSVYPNPATDRVYLQVGLNRADDLTIDLYDLAGSPVRSLLSRPDLPSGVYNLALDLPGVPAGKYLLQIRTGDVIQTWPLVISR